ncbi:MAG: GNAT family N-acetyltransferase [Pseudonocardiales bacterium]
MLHGPLDLRETQARLAAAAEELYQSEPAYPAEVLIGYALNPRFQGNGYATEAVGCLISWLFRRGAAVVYANTYADNVSSTRLLGHLDFVVYESFSAEQDESGRGLASYGLKLDRARHVPGCPGYG